MTAAERAADHGLIAGAEWYADLDLAQFRSICAAIVRGVSLEDMIQEAAIECAAANGYSPASDQDAADAFVESFCESAHMAAWEERDEK